MRRRPLLTRSAVVVALGLAGCTGGPDGDVTADPDDSEPTETPTDTPTPTATDTPTQTGTDEADQRVTVGPGGGLRFDPESFEIAVGDTVLWRFDAGGHNVRPSSTPDGADWPGTEGGDAMTFSSGHTHSYTFEVAGTYEYYCAPHRSAGMTGSFTVG